jgi:lipid II:glycine glycyltransferase (peptidoglycan interpeptide bridge formation enzyme)
VNVTVDTSDESKDFLFNIHFENMRAIQSGLHKDKKIFDLFYKKYQAGKDYNIFIAKKNDIKLAALLVFYFNKITEYYTPVIVKQYRSNQPLTALIHEAIKYSVSKNFLYWNWGGNGIGLNNVYEFKKKWGAKDYFYNYYTKINNENFLNLSSEVILNEYRGFYTVPFDNLNN